MDCPRCGTENDLTEQYCIYCSWPFLAGWSICSSCNQTLKNKSDCKECHREDAWTSNSLDNWYRIDPYSHPDQAE